MYQQGYRVPQQPINQTPQRPQTPRPPKKKKHSLLPLFLVVILIAALICGSYFLKAYLDVKPFESVYLNNIFIDGIHLGGMKPQEAIDAVFHQIQERQNSWSLNLNYGSHTYYTLTYETLGIHTDSQQVVDLLNQALKLGHTGNTFDRKKDIEALAQTPFVAYTTQTAMTDQYLDSILQQIADNMYRSASDAYLVSFNPDLQDPFTIQPESHGQYLDVENVKTRILEQVASATSGTLELVPEVIAPTVTTQDIRQSVTLLGTGITPVSEDSIENRTNNIRVALSRYNGLIVKPGDRVSFNRIVGERSFENGFYTADEYVSGNLTTGIGGGVCQASSTVYLAALLSNLEINDRESHSDVVSYTTFGQDATVYWSNGRKIDFVFTNSTSSPIYITAHVEEVRRNQYQCVVKIYGASMGENVNYSLETRTVQSITAPLEPEYIKDSTLAPGEEKQTRKARDGFINETYLIRWENGAKVSETFVSRDTCQARAAQFHIGPTLN